jgi:hypothetical protein
MITGTWPVAHYAMVAEAYPIHDTGIQVANTPRNVQFAHISSNRHFWSRGSWHTHMGSGD